MCGGDRAVPFLLGWHRGCRKPLEQMAACGRLPRAEQSGEMCRKAAGLPGAERQQSAAFPRQFVARRVPLVQANSASVEFPSWSTGWDLLR